VQLPEIVAIVALIVAAVAGTGLALVYRQLRGYRRNQHVIMGSRGSVDIVEHVSALDEKLANMRVALEDLTLAARDHDVRIDGTLSRVGIVRFDAYQDLGGRQSTAIAFLNSLGDGVVITTVVSRDFARIYVKLIKEGTPDIALAPEESEAVAQARGTAPFTIRPRVEGAIDKDAKVSDDLRAPVEGAPMAAGLPGLRGSGARELARENRKRQRQGLPPIQGKALPAAGGWDEPETPTPPGATLAEQFLRQRKQVVGKAEDEMEWPADLLNADDEDAREL
jgi:Protein of unknown function (DUF4446)